MNDSLIKKKKFNNKSLYYPLTATIVVVLAIFFISVGLQNRIDKYKAIVTELNHELGLLKKRNMVLIFKSELLVSDSNVHYLLQDLYGKRPGKLVYPKDTLKVECFFRDKFNGNSQNTRQQVDIFISNKLNGTDSRSLCKTCYRLSRVQIDSLLQQ